MHFQTLLATSVISLSTFAAAADPSSSKTSSVLTPAAAGNPSSSETSSVLKPVTAGDTSSAEVSHDLLQPTIVDSSSSKASSIVTKYVTVTIAKTTVSECEHHSTKADGKGEKAPQSGFTTVATKKQPLNAETQSSSFSSRDGQVLKPSSYSGTGGESHLRSTSSQASSVQSGSAVTALPLAGLEGEEFIVDAEVLLDEIRYSQSTTV